ncbi:hypothetical protein [Roseburia sp. 499]|uniref:hypothetical protein n=1 Tax=Roseburia sp. 499 TaxID=1261634 RepID=UPI000950D00A|nr:hypothetical protein [Roseburia sp. 499]WVK70914.1 hypothetical protein BIV20_05110 [Roseburia sp. 499]
MAEKDLIIDDEYCTTMGNYFETQGQILNTMVKDYIAALEKVRKNAIKSGEVAKALDVYITYAKKLDGQMEEISVIAKKQVSDFLTQVDSADEYLF